MPRGNSASPVPRGIMSTADERAARVHRHHQEQRTVAAEQIERGAVHRDRRSRRRAPCRAGTARQRRRVARAGSARRTSDRRSPSGTSSRGREREQRRRLRHARHPVEREEAAGHDPEPEQHRVAPADAHANDSGGQRSDHAANRPRDEADRHVFRAHTEALGAVQRVPRGERLKGELQQQRRRRRWRACPARRRERGPGGVEQRSKGRLGGLAFRTPAARRRPKRKRRRDHEHGAGRNEERRSACRACGRASGIRSRRRTSGT